MVTHFLCVLGTWLYVTFIITLRVDPTASHCVVSALLWGHPHASDQAMSASCVSHSVQMTSASLWKAGDVENLGRRNLTDVQGQTQAPLDRPRNVFDLSS